MPSSITSPYLGNLWMLLKNFCCSWPGQPISVRVDRSVIWATLLYIPIGKFISLVRLNYMWIHIEATSPIPHGEIAVSADCERTHHAALMFVHTTVFWAIGSFCARTMHYGMFTTVLEPLAHFAHALCTMACLQLFWALGPFCTHATPQSHLS